MRTKLSMLSLLFLMLGLPALAGAQPSGPPMSGDSARIEQTLSDLKAKVKISEDQAVTIRAILKENSAAMQRDRQTGQMNREAARERMRAMDERIKAVLTPEQIPSYEKYRDERRQMMRQRARDIQEKHE